MVVLGFSSGGFAARTQAIAAVAYVGLTVAVATLAARRVERLRGPVVLAAAAIWALAGWTLLSGSWSGSQSRAALELMLAFLYATTLVLFALLTPRRRAIPDLLAAIAVASLVLCVAGLMTRLAPDTFAFGLDQRSYGRLQYPVRYASTLGLLAAIGAVISFSFAADARRSTAVKALGAAATPVFATTLLLSYSRGPIAACAVALAVFLVAGLSAATAGALLAAAPPTAVATLVAYHADRLSVDDFTRARAISQGHRVAVALGICVVVAAVLRVATTVLDRRLERVLSERRPRRRIGAGRLAAGAVTIGIVLGAIIVAADLSGLKQEYARFSQPGASQPNTRARLTEVQGGDRLQAWKVALAEFRRAPVIGRGAGTFVLSWDRNRPYEIPFNETHSLYLQMLGELGLVGAALLLLALGLIVVCIGIGARGADRVSSAAALAVALGWAVAVSVDWHWQMPVGTLWLFAIGGAALVARRKSRRLRWPLTRWLGILALGGAAILPARVAIAESHLHKGLAAFRGHNCPAAEKAAREAHAAFGVLASPLMLLGYCAAISGDAALAVHSEEQAVSRDPDNWTARYALATVRAAEGLDPRPAAGAAQRLNPLEPLVVNMVHALRGSDPQGWRHQVSTVPVILPSDFDA
jgi:hypothetical protein